MTTDRSAPRLSVIIPAYREGGSLRATLKRVAEVCRARIGTFEIIVVVDGPEAETLDALADATHEWPEVVVLVNGQNRGKGFALRRGVLHARGRYVLFTDADLSIPFETASKFVVALDAGADLVIATRLTATATERGPRALGRRSMTRVFSLFVQATMLPGISDSQCGFKAFRREVARRLFRTQRVNRFAFDVEVLWLARQWGCHIVEVPVTCEYYSHSSVRRLFDSLSMLRDIARIRWYDFHGDYTNAERATEDGEIDS